MSDTTFAEAEAVSSAETAMTISRSIGTFSKPLHRPSSRRRQGKIRGRPQISAGGDLQWRAIVHKRQATDSSLASIGADLSRLCWRGRIPPENRWGRRRAAANCARAAMYADLGPPARRASQWFSGAGHPPHSDEARVPAGPAAAMVTPARTSRLWRAFRPLTRLDPRPLFACDARIRSFSCMSNKMLIDATHPEETRVVVLRGNRVEEFDFEAADRQQLRGNIYLAKVTRVEPSLQAAFVDYGGNRHGFLAFSEIHPDYYQIPYADRQALLQQQAEEDEEEAAEEAAAERSEEAAAERRAEDGESSEPAAAAAAEAAPGVTDGDFVEGAAEAPHPVAESVGEPEA